MAERTLPQHVRDTIKYVREESRDALPEELHRVLMEADHNSVAEAVVADLFDAVPVIGDLSNISRVQSASEVGRHRERRVALQLIDTVGGISPGIGGVFDIITPSNTLAYLQKRGIIEEKSFK